MVAMSNDRTQLTRRAFVAGAAGMAGALVLPSSPTWSMPGERSPAPAAYPFTLGVASGDPLTTAIVLWTRLAPEPTELDGGMARGVYDVDWELATDPEMRTVVRRGRAAARRRDAYSVHIDVRGLHPGRTFWYRFRSGPHLSPIGRTRTAPRLRDRRAELSLALVSCQRYASGYYTAYDDLAAAEPDLVAHVGDYIYESAGTGVRDESLPTAVDLPTYRARYGLYKSDPSLQAAHAIAPWTFTWDDHEVENNYAGDTPQLSSPTPLGRPWERRRAAAYKAYWEHMPFRRPAPTSADFRIHRRVRWGRVADIFVLDTRQYRDDQPCGPADIGPRCDDSLADDTRMLGGRQVGWLNRGLASSDARWAVLAQQVVFSQLAFVPGDPGVYNLDQWDGYVAARGRVQQAFTEHHPDNNVVLTGDIHAAGVSDLLADYDDPTSANLGAEFIGTSVSSGGSSALQSAIPTVLNNNPHIRWADTTRRGWVHHRVDRDSWKADFRFVTDATVPDSPVETGASWEIPAFGQLERTDQ